MKNLILTLLALHYSLFTSLFASPFEPRPAVECVVYSAKTDSPLHVATAPTNAADAAMRWDFPPSYTGHRSVCVLPDAPTNATLVAWTGGDAYRPGLPFGTSAGRGDRRQIGVTAAHPVFARVNLYDGTDDRVALWGEESGDVPGAGFTNFWDDAVWEPAKLDVEHVRVVPYAVTGTLKTSPREPGGREEWVQLGTLVTNRVVAEFDVRRDCRPCLTEADFLGGGKFDADWDGFVSQIQNNTEVARAVADVTAVKYRLVFGASGPLGRDRATTGTNVLVRAFPTLVERRFEWTTHRTSPTGISPVGSVPSRRPTFAWRIDEPTRFFESSYTCFVIEVQDENDETVYNSGLVRLPPRVGGVYAWQPPDGATVAGESLKWRVAMHNAKFKPITREDRNGWSPWVRFSTAVSPNE